mmetsp:Transcript_14997/g.35372  ORF Transcript_14997/g.35372 Transcript_14997/m.35372 type:complete len:222 (+) Transcript_14997:490-1155(+)
MRGGEGDTITGDVSWCSTRFSFRETSGTEALRAVEGPGDGADPPLVASGDPRRGGCRRDGDAFDGLDRWRVGEERTGRERAETETSPTEAGASDLALLAERLRCVLPPTVVASYRLVPATLSPDSSCPSSPPALVCLGTSSAWNMASAIAITSCSASSPPAASTTLPAVVQRSTSDLAVSALHFAQFSLSPCSAPLSFFRCMARPSINTQWSRSLLRFSSS